MTAPGLDRSLMPDFPGLSQAQSCRDWDTGLPIQVNRIRDKDEDYWRVHRGTPKALINLAAGQRLWANRFGNLTALRFYPPDQAVRAGSSPSAAGRVANSAPGWAAGARLVDAWKRRTEPATVGLRLRPVRQEASAAVAGSQDFGQLFLGFSFFLVAAALLLMMLLFQLGLEQRATETGLLRALGFKPRQVRRLLLGEAGMIALLGGVLGAWLGPAYARAMLTGLATTWNQAVGGTALVFHAERSTLLYGGLAAAIVTGSTMWWALRRQARQPIHLLLAGAAELEPEAQVLTDSVRGAAPGRRSRAVAVVGAALALALVALPIWRPDTSAAGAFFGAGSLLLLAGLAWCASWLASWPSREGYLPEDLARLGAMNLATRETPDSSGSAQSARRFCRMSPAFPGAGSWDTRRLGTASLALRNATRRRRRSLAVIGLLACGCFLVAAVGVFRQDAVPGAERRASGTGGFALIGAATQPLTRDLNSRTGHQAYGLDTNALAGMSIVPFRVRDGEEASCLNLNRAQQPRLLGVRPDLLDVRGAFTFAQTARDRPRERPWRLLNGSQVAAAESEVPAIGDEASLVWALGKKVGDTIQYTDENGRPFRLRLVAALSNSILQGNLVIAEDEFVKRFPGTSGYRLFLVDAPAGRAEAVSRELTRGLQDFGLELAPTVERLAAFNAVQNTYLGTFQALGGFGLALGSIGLGLVVLRNVLERRGELALLLAVGWSRLAVQRLVLTEHSALLLAGLAVGLAAAALAVLPPLVARHTQVPLGTVGLTLAAVFANGMFWTWAATRLALRGRLLDALRNE
jgi:ABC-type antimicrobial peptide transport system permease subunit